MKTLERFREQAIKLGKHFWEHHRCAICGEPVGYYFFSYPPYEVVFDSTCGCSHIHSIHPSSWEDVAEFYNMQDNSDVIKKMDEYWEWEETK